ncbi:MAG TPA: DUF4258 domain-containing protein [Candidatus Paceibacterota bacterium]
MRVIFSKHAEEKLRERGLSRRIVIETVRFPDFEKSSRNFREERYKHFGKNWLKVIVIKERTTIVIITAHWVARARKH